MGCVPAGKAAVLGGVTAWEPARLGEGVGGERHPQPGPSGAPGLPSHPAGWERALHACRGHASPSSGPRPTGTRGWGTAPPSCTLAGGPPFPPRLLSRRQPPSPSEPPGPVPRSALSPPGAARTRRRRTKERAPGTAAPSPRPVRRSGGRPPPPRVQPRYPGSRRPGCSAAGSGAGARRPRRSRGAARAGPGREGKGAGRGTKEPRAAAGASRVRSGGGRGACSIRRAGSGEATPLCSYSLLIYRPGALSSLHGQAFFLCLGRYS